MWAPSPFQLLTTRKPTHANYSLFYPQTICFIEAVQHAVHCFSSFTNLQMPCLCLQTTGIYLGPECRQSLKQSHPQTQRHTSRKQERKVVILRWSNHGWWLCAHSIYQTKLPTLQYLAAQASLFVLTLPSALHSKWYLQDLIFIVYWFVSGSLKEATKTKQCKPCLQPERRETQTCLALCWLFRELFSACK